MESPPVLYVGRAPHAPGVQMDTQEDVEQTRRDIGLEHVALVVAMPLMTVAVFALITWALPALRQAMQSG